MRVFAVAAMLLLTSSLVPSFARRRGKSSDPQSDPDGARAAGAQPSAIRPVARGRSSHWPRFASPSE